jgi:hypothetical protein
MNITIALCSPSSAHASSEFSAEKGFSLVPAMAEVCQSGLFFVFCYNGVFSRDCAFRLYCLVNAAPTTDALDFLLAPISSPSDRFLRSINALAFITQLRCTRGV